MINQEIYTNPLHSEFDESIYWLSVKVDGLRDCKDDNSQQELKKSIERLQTLYMNKVTED